MPDHHAVIIEAAAARSIVGIGVFRGDDRFRACMLAEFGVAAPTTPSFVQAGPVTLSCLSPARYLASAAPDGLLLARLTSRCVGLAAVTDQSDMWLTLTLTGPLASDLLAKLLPINVAPSAFNVGDVACTRASHLDVRLWRIAKFTYEIAVSRSYAGDLQHLLDTHNQL